MVTRECKGFYLVGLGWTRTLDTPLKGFYKGFLCKTHPLNKDFSLDSVYSKTLDMKAVCNYHKKCYFRILYHDVIVLFICSL